MAPAIAVRNLTRTFGDLTAVDNVTLDVPEGSIYGLIGHNGAGKSTTLAMLAALLAPTSGSIEIAGIDPTAKPKEACQRIGYMPDVLGFYDHNEWVVKWVWPDTPVSRELERAYTFGEDPKLIADIAPMTNKISSDRVRAASKKYTSNKQYVLGVLKPESAPAAAEVHKP